VQEIESPGECRLKGKKAPFGAARVRIIYRHNKCMHSNNGLRVHLRRRRSSAQKGAAATAAAAGENTNTE
jgi:hypothetical protein